MKPYVAVFLVVLMAVLLTSDVIGGPPEPEGWVYGETSVSGLSDEEKKRLMMPYLEEAEVMLTKAPRAFQAYTYPPEFDWRDRDGSDFTTLIRDQGPCGSCVAFAVVASIESRFEVATIQPHLNPDWSEAQAFFCGCGRCCMAGSWPEDVLDYILVNGLVDEACFSYIARDQPCILCGESPTVGLTSWVRVDGKEEMRQALMRGPVIAIMEVYKDFFYYRSGIYWPENVVIGPIGLHAITLVGYKDVDYWPQTGYWIAKNSWGTGWGEEGWFRIWDAGIVWLQAYVPFVDAESPVKVYLPFVFKNYSD